MEYSKSFLFFSFVIAVLFGLTCYGDSHVLAKDAAGSAKGKWEGIPGRDKRGQL